MFIILGRLGISHDPVDNDQGVTTDPESLASRGGRVADEAGKQVTLEEAITYLINQNDHLKNDAGAQGRKIGRDRSSILALQAQEFVCAGPEDYTEYDFEDIGE